MELLYLGIDTTGLEKTDSIFKIEIISEKDDEINTFEQLYRPYDYEKVDYKPIPEIATEITGYTDEDVADKPALGTQIKAFMQRFEKTDYLIGWNINGFIMNKFISEYQRFCELKGESFNFNYANVQTIDVFELLKELEPDRFVKSKELKEYYGLENTYDLVVKLMGDEHTWDDLFELFPTHKLESLPIAIHSHRFPNDLDTICKQKGIETEGVKKVEKVKNLFEYLVKTYGLEGMYQDISKTTDRWRNYIEKHEDGSFTYSFGKKMLGKAVKEDDLAYFVMNSNMNFAMKKKVFEIINSLV